MTDQEALDIYNDDSREKQCLEYLIADVMVSRQAAREVFGDESRHEAEEQMLAALMTAEIVFLNTNWRRKEWPEDAQKTIALCVNCNDVFAWASADAERITYDEIADLFDHWIKDVNWGAAIWCMKKRHQMPQAPVEKRIRDAGIWNLDEMNLSENSYSMATSNMESGSSKTKKEMEQND